MHGTTKANKARETSSAMNAIVRLLHAIFHVVRGYWIVKTQFAKLSPAQRAIHVKEWSLQLLSIMGIKLQVVGQPIHSGMLVANHSSWLDNVVIHAAYYCRFVAKREIKSWPVIGYLADQAGVLFVQRTSRRDAHRVVHQVAKRLRAGDCVAVFPEGTTGEGVQLLPFHANMIQSAIDADAPVQPVAIRYIDASTQQQSFAPNFVGEDTLWQSVWRTLRQRELMVVLVFGQEERSQGRDRRAWATDLRSAIHTILA